MKLLGEEKMCKIVNKFLGIKTNFTFGLKLKSEYIRIRYARFARYAHKKVVILCDLCSACAQAALPLK